VNDILPKIDPTAYIRTFVPLFVGAIIGWAVTRFTVVATAIAWLDGELATLADGLNVRSLLTVLAVAAVTAAYYWLARQIGRRWPAVEKWLLGSAATPVYDVAPAIVIPTIEDAVITRDQNEVPEVRRDGE